MSTQWAGYNEGNLMSYNTDRMRKYIRETTATLSLVSSGNLSTTQLQLLLQRIQKRLMLYKYASYNTQDRELLATIQQLFADVS